MFRGTHNCTDSVHSDIETLFVTVINESICIHI